MPPVTRCCLVTGRGGVSPVLAAAGTATPSAASCSGDSSVSWTSGSDDAPGALTDVTVAVVPGAAGAAAVAAVASPVSAVRCADRLPARRRLTLAARSLYSGCRSFRSARTGVAMKIDE